MAEGVQLELAMGVELETVGGQKASQTKLSL